MNHTKEKGFTIVELIITIAVISIISAVFIPVFSGLISRTHKLARTVELKNAYNEYLTKNADNSDYYQQNEIFFAIDNKIYGFINDDYVNIYIDNNELNEENANSYGYKLLNEKYNNLNAYIIDKGDVAIPPISSDKDDNKQDENKEDDNKTNDNENDVTKLEEELLSAWSEFKNINPKSEITNYHFVKKRVDGKFDVYACSDNDSNNFGIEYEAYELEELELFFDLTKTTEINKIIIIPI